MSNELIDGVNTFLFDRSRREYTYTRGGSTHCLLKSHYSDDTDFLYHMYTYNSSQPQGVGQNPDYAGIISYSRSALYDPAYSLRDLVEKTPCLSELLKNAIEQINGEIQRLVCGQPVEVTAEAEECRKDNKTYFLEHEASAAAYRLFYEGKTAIEYEPHFTIVNPTTGDYIRIINDEQGFVRDVAQSYTVKAANDINHRLWELDVIRERLDELINQPGEHHTRREIANSISDDMRMVNVHVRRDGLDGEFKVEAHIVVYRARENDTICTYSLDAPSRRAYESQFGRHSYLHFSDIQRITYGKKILFQRPLAVEED